MAVSQPEFKQALVPLQTHLGRADELKESFGKTDLYKTGSPALDAYLGGGIGRKSGYEMVLIHAEPGMGKSLLGLNMMLDPIKKGLNVGMMILEDDPADVLNRLRMMTNNEIDEADNVFFADDQSGGYTLEQAMDAIEMWFDVCDVILLDHLEYLFVGSVGESERQQYQRQEVWMRKLNTLMKANGKTIVMIQHTNKGGDENMSRIKGSSAFAQTCSKVIFLKRGENGNLNLMLQKTRFTPYRTNWLEVKVDRFRVADA